MDAITPKKTFSDPFVIPKSVPHNTPSASETRPEVAHSPGLEIHPTAPLVPSKSQSADLTICESRTEEMDTDGEEAAYAADLDAAIRLEEESQDEILTARHYYSHGTLEAWAEACYQGDEDAFMKLFTAFQSKLYIFAFNAGFTHHTALEITQEILVRVLLEEKYRWRRNGGSSFQNWTYRLAKQHIISLWRKKERKNISLDSVAEDDEGVEPFVLELMDGEPSPERRLEAIENINKIRSCIDELPDKERDIVQRWKDEPNCAEIARKLKWPESTVRKNLKRGLALLEKSLIEKGVWNEEDGQEHRSRKG